VKHDAALELGAGKQLVERGVLDRAAEVLQLERRAGGEQVSRHAQDGRNADTAREQQMVVGVGHESEIVARSADLQRIALLHPLVHR